MRILLNVLLFVAIGLTGIFLYVTYGTEIKQTVLGRENVHTVYIQNVPVLVSVANTPETMARGLGGVTELGTNEGKLFIFDHAAKHGIWMKGMLIPIDILWINESLEVVHIERDVQPETFPTIFAPSTEARFVLEVNAHFTDVLKVTVGNRVTVPPEILPVDIRKSLQQ